MSATLGANRNFRLLFSASAVSNLGDGLSTMALPWLATLFTRDPFLIGLAAMAGRLPWLLFTLPAGVLTDRHDRRQIMLRADLIRFVLMIGVLGLVLSAPALPLPEGVGTGQILLLAALSFCLGTAEVLRDNAAQTVLPAIVSPEQLETANGRMWSAEWTLNYLIGPPLAGVLIGLGIAIPLGLDAASFAVAATLVWLITLPARPAPAQARFRAQLAEGIAWFRAHPVIWRLALMLSLSNFFYVLTLTGTVLFAQEVLGLSASGYGIALSAGAVGGVVMGLVAPRITGRLGMRSTMLISIAIMITAYAALAATRSPAVLSIALALESGAAMLWNVVTVSYRQRLIPDDLLGRVNSIYRMFGWGSMPLGAFAAGTLIAALEAPIGRETALRLPYALAALANLGLLALALRWLPRRGAD